MKRVKQQFPSIWMVVLTCHQDFEYIQEALRLGAIDYIVKTQLDKEKMEDILERIVARIGMASRTAALDASSIAGNREEERSYSLLVDVSEDEAAGPGFPLDELAFDEIFEAADGLWLIRHRYDRDRAQLLQQFLNRHAQWLWVDLLGVRNQSVPALCERLAAFMPAYLFYAYSPGQKAAEVQLAAPTAHGIPETGGEDAWSLSDRVSAMNWMTDEAAFASLLARIEAERPEWKDVYAMLEPVLGQWRSVFKQGDLSELLQYGSAFRFWHQAKSWSRLVRSSVQRLMLACPYSSDIILNMMKAVRYMRDSEDYHLKRDELAAKLLMSGSYFSQCFKDIVGLTFGEYMKEIRLEKAMFYLVHTDWPIYKIAEKTGFQDEKYFSKSFNGFAGSNPNEYRKQLGKASGRSR
jgi:two-component system, response regulator YesN